MIDHLLRGLRTVLKSKGFSAMTACGIVGLLSGSLYVVNGHPLGAIISLTFFAVMVLMAMSLVVRLRWVQETEARRTHSRFRELRETLAGISTAVHRLPQGAAISVSGSAALESSNTKGNASSMGSGPTGGNISLGKQSSAPAALKSAHGAGRAAAAVLDDGRRQSELLKYLALPSPEAGPGRVLYIIAGPEFRRHLADSYALESLHPSTVGAQIGKVAGSAIILEDSAFLGGAWFGADSAAGTLLANEILRTLAFCREQGIPIYVVRTRRESNIYMTDFERAADLVISGRKSMRDWAEDYELGLLGSIAAFVDMKKEVLVG